ncbi:MAG: histidine ammonia-lyase [Anaerolineales bacterium]|nr:histidine ammonia-lyase [Anaerolineales bacterium]
MTDLVLDGQALSLDDVSDVARNKLRVCLGANARVRMAQAQALVAAIAAGDRPVYGINTGFGSLSRVRIAPDQTRELQLNLVRSHAAAVGEPLPDDVVRAVLLIGAASLARGHSGARPEVVELMCACLNHGVTPVVPARGSLGASGDLAPLAHVALSLIGEGRARFDERILPGGEALRAAGLAPLQLGPKEGLALLNGTHVMTALGALAIQDATTLLEVAQAAAAMSLDAALGTPAPLDPRIHALRGQPGQIAVAARLRNLLAGSELPATHRENDPRVQDPYSLRCAPQVLGAVADGLGYVRGVIAHELGAVTDNPLVFADDGVVLSGGNFHGQPLALALDLLAVTLTHLAAISERRTYLLLTAAEPEMKLPAFLSGGSGLESGLMIAQYTAAALVNECTVLAHPASVANIPSSAGMEDYNSMGATAALKARQVLELARRVVAIELLVAAQALDYHRPLRSGAGVEAVHAGLRQTVPFLTHDRVLADDIAAIVAIIESGELVS